MGVEAMFSVLAGFQPWSTANEERKEDRQAEITSGRDDNMIDRQSVG